jgi:hypothetical protein
MTFDEFFKKKRIDLDALENGQPGLFSEFKTHYSQMGEKSFDHTKKYWFNKLRGDFPLAEEIKTDKVKIDNPLAEQTITESLTEQLAPSPKLGFVPKFRAANPPKPVADATVPPPAETSPPAQDDAVVKPAYKPRFNVKNIPKKEGE